MLVTRLHRLRPIQRLDLRPSKARQLRPMVDSDNPLRHVTEARIQCMAPAGVSYQQQRGRPVLSTVAAICCVSWDDVRLVDAVFVMGFPHNESSRS